MHDYGLKRNGEGYIDLTAFEAITGAPKPGEIWKLYDKEVVILNNQGRFCNILSLVDEDTSPDNIPITSRSVKFTNPGMISYAFSEKLGQFIKRMASEEFADLMEEVHKALGNMPESSGTSTIEAENAMAAESAAAIERLKIQLTHAESAAAIAQAKFEALKDMYNDLVNKLITKEVAN